jgi:hypothetical protein
VAALNTEAPTDCSGAGLRREQLTCFSKYQNLSTSAETRANARVAKMALIAAGRAKYTVRADDGHWVQLAASRRWRLPEAWIAPTPHKLRRWAKRVLAPENSAVPAGSPRLWGFKTWAATITANPSWSLRSFVGLMLEETADVAH